MVIEGTVTAPVWCYFITEVQKQVIPRMLERVPGMTKEDILFLYDNATAHNKSISGWWMRNIDCYKLTISPYTPEFNPIERMFNTLKWKASDGVERSQLLQLTAHLAWVINEEISKNTFISYFQVCISDMAKHILTFSHLKDEEYPDPEDKIPWKVDLEAESKYKCYNRRYIVTNG